MAYEPQAKNIGKYMDPSYISPKRWSSYAIQIRETMLLKPERVLEIGPGNKIVTNILKNLGYAVETLDVDERVGVDHVGSITDKTLVDKIKHRFDLVLACQIFEHIKYEDFKEGLLSLQKIAPSVIISLPHSMINSRFFYFLLRCPGVRHLAFAYKLIYKRITYQFDGEHYWEMGTKGYPTKRIAEDMEAAGWRIEKRFFNPDNPYHYFFVLKNTPHESQH